MATTGEMLRLARHRRGFTQTAVAYKLRILQNVLSRFENDVVVPDEILLQKAASLYQVPREFFDLPDPVYGPPGSVHPMTRGKSDVTARDLDMVTAELNVRTMHLARLLKAVDFAPTIEIPRLDVEQHGTPESIAGVVRANWGLAPGPVENLMKCVERAGVIVGLSQFGGASISGVTYRVPGKPPLVLLNAHHPGDRQRYTLAHELGHLVMHPFPTPNMEVEATQFASAFLMPAAEIRAAFQGHKVTLPLLASLKPEWRTAMQALLMRASSLELISANQARYLWQQISARGWRLQEPADVEVAPEVPVVLPSIIRFHLGDLGYSIEDLAKLLCIHAGEFAELYGDFAPAKTGPRLRVIN
jgi:Zn-dependent peptidase ImmA (M78 family)/transcriptional regulator with XRE-family HTH domain